MQEIGDGNVNYIYLTEYQGKRVIVKEARPFARCNPEAFPLSQRRLFFEYSAYLEYQKWAPERIPEIFAYEADRARLTMEYISPHIVLRKGFIEKKIYPRLAEHLGQFLARVGYMSSKYAMPVDTWDAKVQFFSQNQDMREIIRALNFTDPFFGSPLNWWNVELNALVKEIQGPKVQQAALLLKEQFFSCSQCLAHGDLHTGSILVTEEDTRIFDPEFVTYAPFAYDIGTLFAHLFMAHMKMQNIQPLWAAYCSAFRSLWESVDSVEAQLEEIWSDALKFMGAEIIRRVIGVAHIADFESIADCKLKVAREEEALLVGRDLMMGIYAKGGIC